MKGGILRTTVSMFRGLRLLFPRPEGPESFGKRRREFARSKGPAGAERAGASESLGRGEGDGPPNPAGVQFPGVHGVPDGFECMLVEI